MSLLAPGYAFYKDNAVQVLTPLVFVWVQEKPQAHLLSTMV